MYLRTNDPTFVPMHTYVYVWSKSSGGHQFEQTREVWPAGAVCDAKPLWFLIPPQDDVQVVAQRGVNIHVAKARNAGAHLLKRVVGDRLNATTVDIVPLKIQSQGHGCSSDQRRHLWEKEMLLKRELRQILSQGACLGRDVHERYWLVAMGVHRALAVFLLVEGQSHNEHVEKVDHGRHTDAKVKSVEDALLEFEHVGRLILTISADYQVVDANVGHIFAL
mmetsp:Transcript_14155/g.40077  ORF Transcript_14155/g.40077 Transcript_14155/m.40077 type:complete len:221 (+) Transcript_14155:64-726(+)